MRFSLARLFAAIAFIAVLFGWWRDHSQLSEDGRRLNAETASLYAEVIGDGRITMGFEVPNTEPFPGRIYNWQVEKDRIEYRQNFGFKPAPDNNDFDFIAYEKR